LLLSIGVFSSVSDNCQSLEVSRSDHGLSTFFGLLVGGDVGEEVVNDLLADFLLAEVLELDGGGLGVASLGLVFLLAALSARSLGIAVLLLFISRI